MAKTRRAPEDDVRRRPDDEDDAPRKARRDDADEPEDDEPMRPRRKRKSAAGPVKLVLRIGAGVVGAVLLFILLYWIYSPIGTDSSLLCYFPPETISLTGYDVADGNNNAKFKDVHDQITGNYKNSTGKKFPGQIGLTDKDVVRYMTGQVAPGRDEDTLSAQERRGTVSVIRFRNSVDSNVFANAFAGPYFTEERTAHGRKYYQVYRMAPEREDDISFFFPNSKTLVYATTRRECEECMTRQAGRVVVEGDMRELANKVDGTYFSATTGWGEYNEQPNAIAFGLGFVDAEVRDQKSYPGLTGTAMWIADNVNDFLFASAVLYSDVRAANEVRNKLQASFYSAQSQIYRSEGGKPSGLEDPFNAKQKDAPRGGGSDQSKDIIEALAEYAKSARAYNRGRLVIIEGTIPHGTQEQGIFEKFWKAIQGKYSGGRQGGFGGPPGMPGGGMPGMPGMPGGGMPMPGGPSPPPR